jgi:hypothetical protein
MNSYKICVCDYLAFIPDHNYWYKAKNMYILYHSGLSFAAQGVGRNESDAELQGSVLHSMCDVGRVHSMYRGKAKCIRNFGRKT